MNAVITGTGMNLPERVLTNADVEAYCDTSDEWIRKRTGIGARHRAEPGTGTSDLALPAAEAALAAAGLDAAELDAILFCTVTPDKFFPASGNLLQGKLGAVKAASFDINAACTGFVCGMATANGFIQSGLYRKVLVVGAEITSPLMYWERRDTAVLFGDGASAVLLSRNEDPEIGVQSHFTRTDGGGMRSLWIYAGGSDRPIDEEVLRQKLHYVQMSGSDVFKFAIQAISESANKVMEQEGLADGDIRLMVPHQANQRIIQAAAKKLNIPSEQVYVNIDRYGNTVGASVGLALCDAYHENRLASGDKVLVVGFGAGLSWGATVINWSLS